MRFLRSTRRLTTARPLTSPAGARRGRGVRNYPTRSAMVGAAAVVTATLALSAVSFANASNPTHLVASCVKGMSKAKCASFTRALNSYAAHPPAVRRVARTRSAVIPATLIACGPHFLSPSSTAQLTRQFGGLSCFRIKGQDRWIIVGNGMSQTAATLRGTPGGSIVAIESCARTDSACLNPNVPRSFRAFEVSRAATMLKLQSTVGTRLLTMTSYNSDQCGLLIFDLRSLSWYRATTPAQTQALLSRPGSGRPISAGPLQAGARALAGPVPASALSCG